MGTSIKHTRLPTLDHSEPKISSKKDFALLFFARCLRMFSYGWISVIIFLFLREIHFSEFQVGTLLTFTLLGDIFMTFVLSSRADVFGRRRTLLIGALLKILVGVVFALVQNVFALVIVATIGILPASGGETGPFMLVEQAAITELINDKEIISRMLGYYTLCGFLSQAFGALVSGWVVEIIRNHFHVNTLQIYQILIIVYTVLAFIKLITYWRLSDLVEPSRRGTNIPIHDRTTLCHPYLLHNSESKWIIFKTSFICLLDALGSGFLLQTFVLYWFYQKFGLKEAFLGTILMATDLVVGFSGFAATPLVKKIGPLKTMMITHLPSNCLLFIIPFVPEYLSIIFLILRSCFSQMDTPSRQYYITLIIKEEDKMNASSILNIIRTFGISLSPLLATYLLEISTSSSSIFFTFPFLLAGVLKIIYNIILYIQIKKIDSSGGAYPANGYHLPLSKHHVTLSSHHLNHNSNDKNLSPQLSNPRDMAMKVFVVSNNANDDDLDDMMMDPFENSQHAMIPDSERQRYVYSPAQYDQKVYNLANSSSTSSLNSLSPSPMSPPPRSVNPKKKISLDRISNDSRSASDITPTNNNTGGVETLNLSLPVTNSSQRDEHKRNLSIESDEDLLAADTIAAAEAEAEVAQADALHSEEQDNNHSRPLIGKTISSDSNDRK